MRQIKFRVWDSEKMINLSNAFSRDLVGVQDGNSFELESFYENVEIMQYTGLKDKNGIEIYEGDIIFFEPFGTHNNDRIVKFEQGCFVGELIRNGYSQPLTSTDLFEVIGNIHETEAQE